MPAYGCSSVRPSSRVARPLPLVLSPVIHIVAPAYRCIAACSDFAKRRSNMLSAPERSATCITIQSTELSSFDGELFVTGVLRNFMYVVRFVLVDVISTFVSMQPRTMLTTYGAKIQGCSVFSSANSHVHRHPQPPPLQPCCFGV